MFSASIIKGYRFQGAPLAPHFKDFQMLRLTMTATILSTVGFFYVAPLAHAMENHPVKLCTFPLSPTKSLDIDVARAVFKDLSIPYRTVDLTKDLGNRSTSKFAIAELLKSKCDVFSGIPILKEDLQFKNGMAVSAPYLTVEFVKFSNPDAKVAADGRGTVAVAYETPGQLIAAEEGDKNFDVENTTKDVIDAVVSGKAEYGIGWYPSLLKYENSHHSVHFSLMTTKSKVSNWHLSFVADARNTILISKISRALGRLSNDVAFQKMVKPWAIASHAATISSAGVGSIQPAVFVYKAGNIKNGYRLIDVSDNGGSTGNQANFAQSQVGPGKKLYAAECAQCHGDNLQGHTAPALKGPGFAPTNNSTMTIGGIFLYMMTNMPADKPGKLKPKQYADIMAFLLHANGYMPNGKKLDPSAVQDDQQEFDSFVQ
ncbi:MAG: c-type cytochrome [Thiomonas arsenitoxydans]|nr:c-type cytochrome [Thiomonas arsenitoxydans]MBN8745763.1 c-type cytochrome [Thiomonas arsenitoxydans]